MIKMPNNRVEIKISGMHCDGCAKNIRRALKRIEGVTRADVIFKESRAEVEVVPGKVTIEQLEKAIQKAGYDLLK